MYNLLDNETYRELLMRPKILEERLVPSKTVVIDEIQKLPELLDEVHRLIEARGTRFLLTGSSARKLRRGGANLLAGRAWEARLFPLSWSELAGDFDLLTYLNRGGLPAIYPSSDFKEELSAYVGTYLTEEIRAESVTRNLSAFSEFLNLIALSNGGELNYESMASDCGVSPSTLKAYLQVLEDTLIGFTLPGFTKTKKRKAITRAKHYLFDIGVTNHLCQRVQIAPKSELFGNAFQHFLITEIRTYNSYSRKNFELFYWRSTSQFEVDLIIGNTLALEIKSSSLVSERHLKGLKALKEEGLIARYICISQDHEKRVLSDNIEIWPWQSFLKELWAGNFF